MDINDWIKENREEIDQAILNVCPNCNLDDQERRLWILNDQSLYNWARSKGVDV